MLIRMLLHTFDTHTCEGIKIARLCAVPCALCSLCYSHLMSVLMFIYECRRAEGLLTPWLVKAGGRHHASRNSKVVGLVLYPMIGSS